MGEPIDMERKGCEVLGCWTPKYVILTFDLIMTLTFYGPIFKYPYLRNGRVH